MDTDGLSFICTGLSRDKDENGNPVSTYTIGKYCLDNLKDLQRFLRRDDPQRRDVFKQICRWNVVTTDLIPIIEGYQGERNLVINAVKILVFLTMPIDPTSDDIAQQMEYLWDLKDALTRTVTVTVIVALLEDPLDHLEHDALMEDDWKLVQLVLTFFRNLLSIQCISVQQKASGSATRFLSLRDRFLEVMFQENVMDLILVLTQHLDGSSDYLSQDNLLLLEIFHYIVLGHDPKSIANCSRKDLRGGDIKISVDSLQLIMEEEDEKRRKIRQRNLERPSQFSGMFTRLTMDGSKSLFKGNPAAVPGDGFLKAYKVLRGPQKRIAWDHGDMPLPKENIRESLYNFLGQFLSGGYNVLMQSIRNDIIKEHQAIQNSDIIIFFQVADFVITFQYQVSISKKPNTENTAPEASPDHEFVDKQSFHGDFCGPIASTMNEAMFQLVISKWREAFENLKVIKDHKFLSAAVSLMKRMIRMLDLVLELLPEDSKESQTARILLYKIFYDQTDQGLTHFLLNLFREFDGHKQPKSDLADLLEIIHVLFRLMEKLQARGTLRVATKSRKSRKKMVKDNEKVYPGSLKEELDCPRNSDNQTEKSEMPNEPIVDLNKSAVENVNESASAEMEDDVGKGSDTLVPDPSVKPDMPPRGTGHHIDGLSRTDNDKISKNLSPAVQSGIPPKDTEQPRDDSLNIDTDKESSDDEQSLPANEVDFHVTKLVASFANNAVIQNLCWLLKYYRNNSISTNHYIICMLQRFCEDLEISPMLYQLSVLTTFYSILADQKSSKEYRNIVKFLTKFIRKMLMIMKKQPLLFVEILFWKTRRECHYINAEALMSDIAKMKKEVRNWDTEGINASNGNGRPDSKSIADSLGDDEADLVIPHDISHQREESLSYGAHQDGLHKTKSSLTKRNNIPFFPNENDGDESESASPDGHTQKASKRQKGSTFSKEEEASIKDLYERYKDNRRCSRLIAEALGADGKISPLQVACKLRQLGLKVVTRKTMASAYVPLADGGDRNGDDADAFTSSSTPGSSNKPVDDLLPKTSLHTRKRVRAFSKEQEAEVKILFERFKNHKKCSRMIANALDADNSYTAAQVSRKLRQLGLVIPNKRSSKAAKQSGDEVAEIREQSDEETLVAIKERSKRKKSKPSEEAAMESIAPQETTSKGDHDSDNEILSSMLRTKRKKSRSSMKKAERTDITQDEAKSGLQEFNIEILSTGFKKQELDPSEAQDGAGDSTALNDDFEAELTSSSRRQDGHVATSSKDGWSEQQTHDEVMDDLADSEDDMGLVLPRNMGSRRSLKMVFDAEDD